MTKKYLDTNLFLNPILYNDKKANKCKEIVSKIALEEIKGITSALTWGELVYTINKYFGKEIAIKEGDNFIKFPNLVFVEVDINIISSAQKLISNYNLRPRDAIHAATALAQNCTEIISDDSDFDNIKEIKRISPEKFK
ncbi:type II toxin-antitoxin system VapC family toxin [Candidatus Pacearchaeota archaeon]|nr:type II toxin-antitoxin system VapC family toxin [Candidatus Pacearchaeota archaeon]